MRTFFCSKFKKYHCMHSLKCSGERTGHRCSIMQMLYEWMTGLNLPSVIFSLQAQKSSSCNAWIKTETDISVVHLFLFYELYRVACSEDDCNTLMIFKHYVFLKEYSQRKNWEEIKQGLSHLSKRGKSKNLCLQLSLGASWVLLTSRQNWVRVKHSQDDLLRLLPTWINL